MHATQETELTLSGLLTVTADDTADGRLPLSEALQLGLQVARMVAQAHDAGRVVGELNASRLRFAASGALALGAMRGTPLAPELRAGEKPDRLSDVYAVGALIYRLLTGKDVSSQRVPEPPSHFNPAVDGDLDELVMSALDEDPSERPISGRVLEQGVLRVFEELDVEPSMAEVQQVISKAKQKVKPKPVPVATPVVARKPAPRPVMVDEDDDDDELVAPARVSGPPRSWLVGGGIAVAVFCALVFLWPGKKASTRAVIDELPRAAAGKLTPPVFTAPTVSPVRAVPVEETMPAMGSGAKVKKVVYAKKSR